MTDIGDNIRAIRKRYGVTQERLAELSGLSVNFISRLERTSDQNVSLKSLNKIATALQVSLTQLINYQHNEPSKRTSNTPEIDQLCFELKLKDQQTATDLANSFLQILKYIK
ncbi:helix-turn-helix transcriptional regulator [Limosilactobacillus sp. Lr3000]|uniref:Helix-turn-helix transcriptional regulator n=1 Tax=Limosilactobacillus albertensis TaxID=2759752 RepID=A0A839H7G5_9LACO|nr:helix-turn-helix transcriptional regulator [Limosilactobacillus albertensis]